MSAVWKSKLSLQTALSDSPKSLCTQCRVRELRGAELLCCCGRVKHKAGESFVQQGMQHQIHQVGPVPRSMRQSQICFRVMAWTNRKPEGFQQVPSPLSVTPGCSHSIHYTISPPVQSSVSHTNHGLYWSSKDQCVPFFEGRCCCAP